MSPSPNLVTDHDALPRHASGAIYDSRSFTSLSASRAFGRAPSKSFTGTLDPMNSAGVRVPHGVGTVPGCQTQCVSYRIASSVMVPKQVRTESTMSTKHLRPQSRLHFHLASPLLRSQVW